MVKWVWLALISLLWMAGPVSASNGSVIIVGNDIIKTEALLDAVALPQDAWVTPTMAVRVRYKIESFYFTRGYTLARAWTKAHRGKLYVSIDEGRLEKIIVRGRGSTTTLAIKFLFKLEKNIYNRFEVERQLKEIRQQLNIGEIETLLVESPKVQEVGFQLSDLDMKIELFEQKVAAHELHIIIAPSRGSGPSIGAYTSATFGFVPYIAYTERGPFFDNNDDKLRLSLETGYNIRKGLNNDRWQVLFTHAMGKGRYDFPPLVELLRFFLVESLQVSSYSRADLPLDEYWRFRVHSSVNLGLDLRPGLSLYVGGGVEYESLFSIKPVLDDVFLAEPFNDTGFLLTYGFEWDFDPSEMRRDRHHRLLLEIRHFWPGQDAFHRLNVRYQKVFVFGYNDLILRGRLLATLGDTKFYEEVSLGGKNLRTFFNGRYYVDTALWATLEFRLSLWKDIIKVSVFHDLAPFFEIERKETAGGVVSANSGESHSIAIADSFGPGFHWLFLDSFQLDFYGCVGFSPSGFGWNIYFTLFRVF